MPQKQFQLDDQSLDQLLRINASIEHQSVQYAKARLQIQEMENGIRGLYSARQQLMNKCITANGMESHLVSSINLDEKGVATVELRDPPSPAGDDVDPTHS